MKAQSMFGGKPKATGERSHRAMGNKSSSPGVSSFKNNAHPLGNVPQGKLSRKTTVKQVGHTTKEKGNSSQMVRDRNFKTADATKRPSLAGKENNRAVC